VENILFNFRTYLITIRRACLNLLMGTDENFNVITGKVWRIPACMQKLDWFYRFVQEPQEDMRAGF